METAAATARPGAARKRQRSRSPPRDGEGPSELKHARLRLDGDGGAKGAWEHLDLVLSLQGKELALERKIELAVECLATLSNNSSHVHKTHNIQLSRLVSVIGNWVQSILNFPENSKKMLQPFDPALDSRCWVVLRVCIEEKPSIAISLNLLKSLSRVARHGLGRVDSNMSRADNESIELFERVSDCMSLLFSSNTRVFFNAGVDLWASCVIEVIKLAQKVSANEDDFCPVLQKLANCLLGQFSSFLRFYANPKNMFHAFVDKIVGPLLELLVLLHSQANSSKRKHAGTLLKIVEDVLSNGLFHPQHLSGYFGLRSLNKSSAAKDIKGSYHRHLFQRFKGIKTENKAVLMAGFGYLLQLFVSRARNQRTTLASSGITLSRLQKSSEGSEEPQQHRESLFEVFIQFMEPMMLECRLYSQKDFSKLGVTSLVEVHCMLKSINVMLTTLIEEKIYVPTEDTSEGSYFNFLQDIYTVLISISEKMYEFWVSAEHLEDVSIKKIVPLMFAEIIAAVGSFLEIEYKVLGGDIMKLWLMIFALSAINASSKGIKPCLLLASRISSLSAQVICTFSELRQVSLSIFRLCNAVRAFRAGGPDALQGSFSVASLSSHECLESLTTLLSSETLMDAIRTSVKSMPEGQSSRCIADLTSDLTETLNWMTDCSIEDDLIKLEEPTIARKSVFYEKAELLGRHLSEIYTSVLDSIAVTASNSTPIGKSVEKLINAIQPNFSHLVRNGSKNLSEFISSVIGKCISKKQHANLKKNPNLSWICAFFFRLYISCRSLYQQCIGLMPPDVATEATKLVGNPFIVCSGKEWTNPANIVGKGYFALIVENSSSLVDVIESLSQSLSRNGASFAQLDYTFHVMALQRLNDLNRQIKAFQFLLEDHGWQLSKEDIGSSQLLEESCSLEASKLTSFMMNYVKLLSSGENDPLGCYEVSASLGLNLCSLDEGSFPIATWRLLCENIDMWSSHASKKDLKNFFSNLIRFSFVEKSSSRYKEQNNGTQSSYREMTLHSISVVVLCDTIIYDQKVLLKNLASSFCHALKKFLSFIGNSDEDNVLLDSSVDLMETISNLENGNLTGPDSGATHAHCIDKHWICEDLLNFFSAVPGFHANSKSFARLINYMLHLERMLLLKLLGLRCESCNPMKLLRLFICCRRVMINLILKIGKDHPESKQYLAFSEKNGNSYCHVWFLRSVQEIVGSSHEVFDECADEVNSMMFSLLDKTSELFSTLASVNLSFSLLDYKRQIRSSLSGSPIEIEASEHYDLTFDILENPALQHVKSMAELLQKTTTGIPVTIKGSKCVIKLENCCEVVCWKRLSCTMSCISGFLWGLNSALESAFKDHPVATLEDKKMLLRYCSIFSSYITRFEVFVDICLHVLFMDNKGSGSVDLISVRLPHELDCENGFLNIDGVMEKWTKSESCGLDLSMLEYTENILLEDLLKGGFPLIAFTLREVYNMSAAIVKLHGNLSFLSDVSRPACSPVQQLSLGTMLGTAFFTLQKIADMSSWPHMFCLVWIDGVLRYLEALGSAFTLPELNISTQLYTQIVNALLRAIGKCILLQGKNATLPTHDLGSSTKTLQLQNASGYDFPKDFIDRQNRLNSLKSRLRILLGKFVNIASNTHLNAAIQVIERALVGVNLYSHSIYEVCTGNPDGGTVSSDVAAGIDCLYLVLDFMPGNKRVFKRAVPGLVGALFNIVLHLKSPLLFYIQKLPPHCSLFHPDAGAVVLMCVEVITSFVGRHSFQIDASHVSQCLHVPVTLFKGFRQLLKHRKGSVRQHADCDEYILDRQFSVDIYAACCKLLCTTLRHQRREIGQCVALLEDSVSILLSCLESTDSKMVNMAGYFAWNMEEALKCASFFRRIYEEMRQQRQSLGKHAMHFLAGYISMFSGQGPFQTGITREIDEALRPGVYSLIDICEESDFQQLHTYLGEGPCRTTLADLVHDYKLHFQYQGKI
ncbi:hypothetical protein HU200_025476 [Digitaria exilis]|uniref:Nucleolar 27S pre-rRNA processing Urb2/Npa2 C-terminal domain-containing protein n=1 Tax=Digitaria exilis TaxID=1010633 RepID=A0A835EW32_9POAL|nr:hypothetical protein HU200_025476 [Digitaria exilis]